jgi:hypothetical protein
VSIELDVLIDVVLDVVLEIMLDELLEDVVDDEELLLNELELVEELDEELVVVILGSQAHRLLAQHHWDQPF